MNANSTITGDVAVLGDIVLITNIPRADAGALSDDDIKHVEQQIVAQFVEAAATHAVDLKLIRIENVSSRRGCIISTLTLGVILSGAAAVGGFIAAYPKLREGLILMAGDIKSVYLHFKHRGEEKRCRVALYKESLPQGVTAKKLKDIEKQIDAFKQRKK